ncbi:hypothetical protein Sdagh_14570 [Streptomyces daghestanicus]|uniref:DJ-1/PfpI domain-containing protein n=1 Tax=Streptomyces daghestanicus TaxID=66885 RepID=A0ABQ3PXG4_9ACTN|nr:hypothetical protein Sdagh_14570 [Streptomyces daghestanicus]
MSRLPVVEQGLPVGLVSLGDLMRAGARRVTQNRTKGRGTRMRIAFLTAPEGVEQVELTEPWQAAKDAGHEPVLVSTQSGEIQAFNHLDKADTFPVDEVTGETSADSFGGPGAARRRGQPGLPAQWTSGRSPS